MRNIRSELNAEAMAEMLELLGCDKKFFLEKASDFERFCACVSALDMLEGSEAAENFVLRLEQILNREICAAELTSIGAVKLWREYNEKKYGDEYTRCGDEYFCLPKRFSFGQYCVEKDNNMSLPVCLNKLLESQPKEFFKNGNALDEYSSSGVYATFLNGAFCRPNRYACTEALKKTVGGEKLNNSEINAVLSQFILEIIYSKKCGKIQLYLELNDNSDYVRAFVEYLGFRRLSARIYLCAGAGVEPNIIVDICRGGGDACFTTPVLKCREKNEKEYLKKIISIYPKALIKSADELRICGKNCTNDF